MRNAPSVDRGKNQFLIHSITHSRTVFCVIDDKHIVINNETPFTATVDDEIFVPHILCPSNRHGAATLQGLYQIKVKINLLRIRNIYEIIPTKRQYSLRCSIITNEPSLLPCRFVLFFPSPDSQLCFALYYVTVSIVVHCPSFGNDGCQSLFTEAFRFVVADVSNRILPPLFGCKFMQLNFEASNRLMKHA